MISERIAPQNIEAEQSVLGAMFLDTNAIAIGHEILKPGDFYREAHRRIFQACIDLFNDGRPVDLVTVVEELRSRQELDKVGGISYITGLAGSVATAAHIEYHSKIIREKAMLRQLINAGTSIVGLGYEPDGDITDVIDAAERLVYDVGHSHETKDSVLIGAVVEQALHNIEQLCLSKGCITGLSTGFSDLDRLTAGLQKSDFIIIAARPSMGKTAFTLNLAANVAIKTSKPVAFFSLEMSKEQLTQRLLCSEAAIDLAKLRIGELDENDRKKLYVAAGRLDAAPLIINDSPGLKISDLRSQARKLKAKHDIQLLVVDYLQLMYGDNRYKENRQQEVTDISRSLKALARELNIPVISLSQLSRQVEQRQNKRPQLSDLRESGSLEQDADIVAFLYRDEYYNPDSDQKHLGELIIAKHRNGPTDSIQLYYHKAYTRFDNYSAGSL